MREELKRYVPPLVLFFLWGCATRAPAPAPPPKTTPLQADQVDTARLQTAQGHLSPGVLVYSKWGFLEGRVIKVEPDYVFPNGTRGAVLYSQDDDPKEKPAYWPFKMFDQDFVLK